MVGPKKVQAATDSTLARARGLGLQALLPVIVFFIFPKSGAIARPRFRELARDSFRQIKKQNAEDHVNGEKLDAFDPVGFAVAADLKQDVNRSDHGEDFWPRKLEVHRLTKQIGDE